MEVADPHVQGAYGDIVSIDEILMRQPVGVVAAITPLTSRDDSPSGSLAIAKNTFILKPSTRHR